MNDVPFYTITPIEGCDEAIGRWLAALEDARFRTIAAIKEASPLDLDGAPAVGRNTIGTILQHIAGTELIWGYQRVRGTVVPDELSADFPTLDLDENGLLYHPTGLSLDDYQRRLQVARDHLVDILKPMSVETFRAPFRCVAEFGTFDATPEAVINHLIQHESEHRAQLTMLALGPAN